MANYLAHSGPESVTLPVTVVRMLEQKGDGDAALLYLALLRHQGTVPPRALAGELRWERERIERAEGSLRELRLLAAEEPAAPPEPADERPQYTSADVAEKMEGSGEFRALCRQVEQRLGKRLTTPDLGILLGLYDYLGLPADVIYLLVCHCAERVERQVGPGRRPGMRQIEKEGYAWARMGIDTQAEAVEHLKRYAARREGLPQLMRALRLPEREPAPSEEKYLTAWLEMGFGPEAVAIAYDKTLLRCGEMKWNYCNGILKKWHETGLHTAEEIEAGDKAGKKPAAPVQPTPAQTGQEDISWMKKYIDQLDREYTKREEA